MKCMFLAKTQILKAYHCDCTHYTQTHVMWNRAGPIFDAWRLVLTNQSKSRGQLLQPHVKTSKLADLNKAVNLKLIQLQPVLLLLLAFCLLLNTTASTPAAKHHQIIMLIGESLDEAILTIVCRGFAIHGTARAELLCTCVASMCEYRRW